MRLLGLPDISKPLVQVLRFHSHVIGSESGLQNLLEETPRLCLYWNRAGKIAC